MRTSMEFSFYCRKSKTGKKGTAPIELSVCLNGKRTFMNMPLKVSPEEFNRKRKPQYIEDYISSQRVMLNQMIVDLAKNNMPLTISNIKDYVRTGGVKSYTVQEWLSDFIKVIKKEVGVTMTVPHFKRYEYVQKLLLDYLQPEWEITRFTPAIAQTIYSDINSKYVPSTSAGYLTKIKRMVHYAMDNGKLTINPFQNIKIKKGKSNITFLTESELTLLLNSHFENQSLEKVKDIFLFCCGTGLSYIDMVNFKPTDVLYKNGVAYIEKPRHKTSNIYTAVILPFAREIGERYGYDFKVISNQKINEFLKIIGKMLDIDTNLHMHLARHQYGMMLLNSGVRIETVSKALGHSNIQTTTRHYAKLLTSSVIEEIKEVI